MSHWVNKYIGLKHVPGARGPTEVDCWGLLYLVYDEVFNIQLPSLPGVSTAELQKQILLAEEEKEADWVRVMKPFDGAAVGMSQSRLIHHVGIYVTADGGKIIHCADRANVIADTTNGLRLKGFRTVEFYRHRSWPT